MPSKVLVFVLTIFNEYRVGQNVIWVGHFIYLINSLLFT